MKKRILLPIMAAMFVSANVFANGNEGKEVAEPVQDVKAGGISVTLGNNNTLYTYHPERNECWAYYNGNREVAYFSWGGNWAVNENSPHSDDYSHVYLKANGTPNSPSTVQVTVHFVDGGIESELFGAMVNNDW